MTARSQAVVTLEASVSKNNIQRIKTAREHRTSHENPKLDSLVEVIVIVLILINTHLKQYAISLNMMSIFK